MTQSEELIQQFESFFDKQSMEVKSMINDYLVLREKKAISSAKEEEELKSKRLANVCYKLLSKLGAGSPTLAMLGSWKDTIDDEEVLEVLEEMTSWEKHNL